jgi:hypothetical protein
LSPVSKLALSAVCLCLAGCGTFAGDVALGAAGVTLLGARSPWHEIEQVYYLGVLDPHEQVPEAVYRVTVKGQASAMSNTKFGSGWVPASFIDSLTTGVRFDARRGGDESPVLTGGADKMESIKTGRRLVLFGPEGFREAPRDHRLVIVMGTSPEAFFEAMDTAIGQFSEVQIERDNSGVQRRIFEALIQLKADRQRFSDFDRKLPAEYR